MRHVLKLSVIVLTAVTLAACNSQQAPAQAAVKAAREAFNTVDVQDQRYMNIESKTIRDALLESESALERAAYPLAIEKATGLPEKIATLKINIEARKKELAADWAKMETALPPLMTQVTNKLKNGGGLPKAAAEKAQADLAAASGAWTEATVAAQSGDVGVAATRGDEVKTKLVDLAKLLKIKVPAGLE